MIASLRALLALMLLAGLYLMVGIMVIVWLAFTILAVWASAFGTSFNAAPLGVAAGAAVVLGLVLREVGRISEPPGPRTDSEPVGGELATLVRSIAEQVGVDEPDDIDVRVIPDANAIAADDGWLLGLRGDRRRLYVGAPLLLALREDELRALLAHELGHFVRRHSRFTQPAYRGSTALAEAQQRIREAETGVRMYAGLLSLALLAYAKVFDALTAPIRRRQELEADRVAVTVAGPAALRSAVHTVAGLRIAWDWYHVHVAGPFRKVTDTVPDDPFHAFVRLVADTDPDVLAELRTLYGEDAVSRFDDHPCLADRLRALATADAGETPPLTVAAAPAVDGLDPAILKRLGRSFMGGWRVRRRPWQEWLTSLGEHRAGTHRRALARAVGGDPTLEHVLDLLCAGRTMDLAYGLDPGETRSDETLREQLVVAVYAIIGQALVARGKARWVVGLAGPMHLVAATGSDADQIGMLGHWVREALGDPLEAMWLGSQLAYLGVDPAAVLIDDADSDPSPRTVTVSVAPDAHEKRDRWERATPGLAIMLGLLVLAGCVAVATSTDDPPPTHRPLPARTTYRQPEIPKYPQPSMSYPLPSMLPMPPLPLPSLPLVPLPSRR